MSFIERHYRLNTLTEASDLSAALAEQLPSPETYRIGIHELLINAIEHGNLEIGFIAKTALLRAGQWEEEIRRRLTLPKYAPRKVAVSIARNDELCRISIRDQGNGFDWKHWPLKLAAKDALNGRGLKIVHACGFSFLSFNRKGNAVVCEANFPTRRKQR